MSSRPGPDPDSGEPLPGVYTAGWVKRGPSGVIGTNKKCAQETVALVLEDLAVGRLPAPAATPDELLAQMRERGVHLVDYRGWEAIDRHERASGEPQGRPRVKLVRRSSAPTPQQRPEQRSTPSGRRRQVRAHSDGPHRPAAR